MVRMIRRVLQSQALVCSGDDCCAYMHTGSELGPDISGIGVKASVSVFQTEGVGSIPTCRSNLLQYSNLGREDGMRVRTVQVRVLSGAPLCDSSSAGRISACQVEAHGFETRLSLHYRGVAQFAQSIRPGTGRSHVQIVLPRPLKTGFEGYPT